jgi:glycosyltransferase involved in cell wall biosynthesis
MKRIVITSNSSWTIWNFRKGFITLLTSQGHEVILLAGKDDSSDSLAALPNVKFIGIPMDYKGINPLKDLKTLLKYFFVYRKERPDFVYNYTIKPVIYSGLVCRLLNIPTISTITGLGTAFLRGGLLARFVSLLYKAALKSNRAVFFQNVDDKNLFASLGLVPENKVELVSGSGINLEEFKPLYAERPPGPFKVLMVARIMYDKGILEYYEAAKLLKKKYPDVLFQVLGPANVENRSAVPQAEFQEWQNSGAIIYLGQTPHPKPIIASADLIVLPSYREGLSRSLIEAAAMGKPIVTTNVPGCREVVDNGINGFLCKAQDSQDLADKIESIIGLFKKGGLESMSQASRKKAEQEFGELPILKRYTFYLQESKS